MATQHKYTVTQQVTENVARVAAIVIGPNVRTRDSNGIEVFGQLSVTFEIGEETGGVFTRTGSADASVAIADLPAQTQTDIATLESRALTYGENQGLFPAGSQEPVP